MRSNVTESGAGRHAAWRLLWSLALNAVYFVGPLVWGWSVGTVVVLFWLEALLAAGTAAVRLHRHRAHRPARGHFRKLLGRDKTEPGSFLGQFLGASVSLSLVYGVFLGVIVFGVGGGEGAWRVDPDHLARGATWLLVVELLRLAVDLVGIADRPFAWAEGHAQRAYSAIFLQHFVILIGMFLLVVTRAAVVFLVLLLALKTLLDWLLASGGPPRRPPGFLRALARRRGVDLDAEWCEMLADHARLVAENEEIVGLSTTGRPERTGV